MRNKAGKFTVTHGDSFTCEYGIWGNMLYRCNTESSPLYKGYGGRGIKVCDPWLDFNLFIADMGRRPSKTHSIDRIDVNGNYCKENCRWATKKQQSRNRTNSRYIYVDGKKLQIDDYCDIYNVKPSTIKSRFRRGWSNERIISTPMRG